MRLLSFDEVRQLCLLKHLTRQAQRFAEYLVGASAEFLARGVVCEIEGADHRSVSSFDYLKHRDLVGGPCEPEASSGTPLASQNISFDQLLKDFEQVFDGNIIFFGDFLRQDDVLLRMFGNIA